jgi:predicted metal-binding membrane protein
MAFDQTSHKAFWSVPALLFAGSVAVTISWCTSMSAMGGMQMPGGWTMSMTWMRMPGQTWIGAAVSFLSMWIAMMVAMMLPSLIPMLQRYRLAVAQTDKMGPDGLTVLVGTGYFFIWTTFGVLVFLTGVVLAMLEMHVPALARIVPVAAGIAVMLAGFLQFTPGKLRGLACCRAAPGHRLRNDAGTAWRYGLRIGFRCVGCCANLMLILLVIGIMDLWAMAAVMTAITAERLVPSGERVVRITGSVAVGIGIYLIMQAI